jgi:hypothetical protein
MEQKGCCLQAKHEGICVCSEKRGRGSLTPQTAAWALSLNLHASRHNEKFFGARNMMRLLYVFLSPNSESLDKKRCMSSLDVRMITAPLMSKELPWNNQFYIEKTSSRLTQDKLLSLPGRIVALRDAGGII